VRERPQDQPQPEMAAPQTPAELAAAAQAAQYRPDPTAGHQPDVIDPRGAEVEESILVDTPENRVAAPAAAPTAEVAAPRPAPKPRARKPKVADPVAVEAASDAATDAAE